MNSLDREVPAAVAAAIPQITSTIADIVGRMQQGGRLIYIGAGTPGRLGLVDASECPPTFNTDRGLVIAVTAGGDAAIREEIEGAEDDAGAGARDLAELGLGELDSVVGISASGRTPYVVGALGFAREVGALSVAVACNRDSRIGQVADRAIEVIVGPELITGSTRLKSGTAQKLVLNMISTIAMVSLGRTYGNLMVDVQASNEKLRDRARRVVETATGVSPDRAAEAIEAAHGSAKHAILMIERGVSVDEASSVLATTPNLRQALGAC
jgi:N-acetylmuramic acid 6-phosphate etherase